MKKRLQKVMTLFLSTAMTVAMLAGCGNDGGNTQSDAGNPGGVASGENNSAETPEGGSVSAGTIDTSEHVDLKMYLIGDRTPDFDEVYGEINKILEEKLNCSISVDFLSWGEHDTKYSLLFSGQEDFDLIFTAAGWCHYQQTVALGGFYPLSEEFIQTYAPGIWEVVPELAWQQATIDGQVYMVPNYQNEFGQDVLAVRGDLLEKYGMTGISNWDDIRKFYLACAADGIYASQGGPWYTWFRGQGYTGISGTPKSGETVLIHYDDPEDLNIHYLLDWDGFSDYCHQMKELADAGCWSKDVLNSGDERQTGLLTGRAATMVWNMGSCVTYGKQANAEHPEWKVTICDPLSERAKSVNSYTTNGVAININSNNKERAMMVLNEFYCNPAIQDLAMLGIEGKHWKAVGDDQYEVIDESNYGVSSNCNWGWTNENIRREEYIADKTALDEKQEEMMNAWRANIRDTQHPYEGFSFDSNSVSTQFAAVEAAMGTYYDPLLNGLVDDVDASIEALRKAMMDAGMQDILDEVERQAKEFLENK